MFLKKNKKVFIHLFSKFKLKLSIKNNLSFLIPRVELILKLLLMCLESVQFNFYYYLKHFDLNLLKRELVILNTFLFKLITKIKKIKYNKDISKTTVLRSPFVNSKSKEQFEKQIHK